MNQRTSHNPRLLLLAVTLTVTVAPACTTSAGGIQQDGRTFGQRLADRIAYRPVYPEPNPVPRTRPLFLSGYAGAQYGTRARRAPVYPTSYQYVPSPWFQWWHASH